MKKFFCIIISSLLIISMLCISASADEKLTVNGKEVKSGDTVTYEYYVGGIDDLVAAAGAYIIYDPKYLEYVDNSIGFDVFNNAMFNDQSGYIYYSAVNVMNGYDLSSERLVVSATFKVKDGVSGETSIKHEFDEFFTIEDESTDISSDEYEDKSVLTVNSYSGQNEAPYLGTDANELSEHINAATSEDIDDLLGGNANSNAASRFSSSSSQTPNSSLSGIPVTSGSASSDSASLNSGSAGAIQSDIQVSSNSGVNIESSSSSDSIVSSGVALQSGSPEEKSGGSKALVVILCIVFVAACAGLAYYLINKRKNK